MTPDFEPGPPPIDVPRPGASRLQRTNRWTTANRLIRVSPIRLTATSHDDPDVIYTVPPHSKKQRLLRVTLSHDDAAGATEHVDIGVIQDADATTADWIPIVGADLDNSTAPINVELDFVLVTGDQVVGYVSANDHIVCTIAVEDLTS